MTQAAPSIALAILGAAFASAGCGSHAPQPRKPEVLQVVVPVEAAATTTADDERRAAGFRCDAQSVGETTRVEFRVQSAARDGSASVQTRAVYTISTEAEHDRRVTRAEVVLESLNTDTPDRAQSAWSVALDAGWISLRRPFEILREGANWCLADACDDEPRQEFAEALGDTAELVVLPGLTEQLGLASDTSAITLPPVLMKRMGLGGIDASQLSSTARRRGRDFPALFVVESSPSSGSDLSEAETTGSGEPFARAELLVSRSCRLQALKVELARTDVTSAGGLHRFSWSFDPLP